MASVQFPFQYHRLNRNPITDQEVFNSLQDLNTYISSGPAYAGQLVSVRTGTNIPDIYKINEDYTYVKIEGGGGSSDPLQTEGVLYVNQSSNVSTQDGTLNYPYKTIQQAIDNIVSGGTILIYPGNYAETLLIDDKGEIYVGSISKTIKINGNITISGNTDVEFKEIVVNGNITKTNENFHASNTEINGKLTLNSPTGVVALFLCKITQLIPLGGEDGYFIECSFGPSKIDTNSSQSGMKLSFRRCDNLTIEHKYGTLIFDEVKFGSDGGIGVHSTSNTGNGSLVFNGGSFYQPDGTYSAIQKIGSCAYSLGSVVFSVENSVFNGVRTENGISSIQIYDANIRDGYNHSKNSLDSHLDGVSDALTNLIWK